MISPLNGLLEVWEEYPCASFHFLDFENKITKKEENKRFTNILCVICAMFHVVFFDVFCYNTTKRNNSSLVPWACPAEKRSLSNKNRLRESHEELFPRGSFFIVFTHGASILPLIFTSNSFLECFVGKREVRLRRPFSWDRRRFYFGRSQNLRPSPRIIASLSTQ